MDTLKNVELSGHERNDEEEGNQTSQLMQQRKTRISFELHPSLLLEGYMNELKMTTKTATCDFDFCYDLNGSMMDAVETRGGTK